MINLASLFSVPGYQARFIKQDDLKQLQDFIERDIDFSELVSGLPPNPTDAQSLFEETPEGKSTEEKALVGIYTLQDNLIGVLDAIRDHPEPGDWWLGLLVIDPLYRGKGLGEAVYTSFQKWITDLGAKSIHLGVVEINQRAYRFWKRMGFEVIEKRAPKRFGKLDQVVIVMRCPLRRE